MAADDRSRARERLAAGSPRRCPRARQRVFRTIVEVDPELLLPYLVDRRGPPRTRLLALLEAGIAEGQADGSVRAGDPVLLARRCCSRPTASACPRRR